MMYETKDDLIRETKVIDAFCKHYKLEKQKLPMTQQIDYALCIDKKIVGFAEVKCRVFKHDQYKSMFVGFNKVQKAKELFDLTRKRVLLLVCWSDVYGHIDFAEDFDIALGGRKDRGDKNDFGLIAHYPIDSFTILGRVPV